MKLTKKERYGDENYCNIKKAKKTILNNLKINPDFWNKRYEKTKKTKYLNHGDENYNNREKAKETCLEKFGVESPMHCQEIFDKLQFTLFKGGYYKDSNLYYQASYEFDFLEKYYEIFKDEIKRGPRIKYKLDGKNRCYYPDFYIPSLNLIIEIKNSYLYERDKLVIKIKGETSLERGYNYIIIIDKDYSKFNYLII